MLTYFCSSYTTEEEIKKHGETVVSMLPCGALERSNNLYIESIVEPCVFKNQKGIFVMWVWLERKAGNGKNYPLAESGICGLCVRKK